MARIHEALYQLENLSLIDFDHYVNNLVSDLVRSYAKFVGALNLEISVKKIILDIDTAIPCGLIINELVTNILKYAFPESRKNSHENSLIVEFLQTDNTFTLCVTDNGIGLPPNFQINNSETLGLQIVAALTKQIDGHLHIESNSSGTGTKINITFPKKKA